MTDLRPGDLGGETGNRLLDYIRNRRWFGQKSLVPHSLEVLDIIPLDSGNSIYFVIVEIRFLGDEKAFYSIPLNVSSEEDQAVITDFDFNGHRMFLRDAFFEPAYAKAVILGIDAETRIEGINGTVKFFRTQFFKMPTFGKFETVKSEQSNSSSIVDRSVIVKNYRYLQDGENPDMEMALALRVRSGFSNVPDPMGYAVYEGKGIKLFLAGASQFLDGSVDAWTFYTERFISLAVRPETFPSLKGEITRLGDDLGKITGSMHRSLSLLDEPAFRPEAMEISDLHEILRGSVEYMTASFELLRPHSGKNVEYLERLEKISGKKSMDNIMARMLSGLDVSGMKKIRVHGDYHLGQILIWKDASYIIDFEGEPVRSMDERRRKQSPMKDLAGIIRSMDYLVSYVVLNTINKKLANEKEILLDEVRKTMIESYKKAFVGYEKILPVENERFNDLLDIYILDKSSYELLYEINNRPSWIEIPLLPVVSILESAAYSRESGEKSGSGHTQ